MSARSFKSVGWVAGIGAAALTCYMFSLSVAAERAEVSELESQIVNLERSIRTLNTELGTRGRVHQLQHWASADFGFTAPAAAQVLDNEVTLAQLELRSDASPVEAPVRMANAPQPAPQMPQVIRAAAPAHTSDATPPRRAAVAASQPRPQSQPLLRRASVTRDEATMEPRRASTRATRSDVRGPAPAPRSVTRASSLLNDRTLRDLSSRERTEGGDRADRGAR